MTDGSNSKVIIAMYRKDMYLAKAAAERARVTAIELRQKAEHNENLARMYRVKIIEKGGRVR